MSAPGSSSLSGHPVTTPPPIDVDPPFDGQSNASRGSSDSALATSNASDVSATQSGPHTAAAPDILSVQADPRNSVPTASHSSAVAWDQNPWPDSLAGPPLDRPSYSMDLSLGSDARHPSPDLHYPSSDVGQPSLNSPMSVNSSALRRADGVLESPTPSVSTNDDQRVPSRSDMRNQTPDSAAHGYVTPEPPPLPAEEILQPAVCPSRALSVIMGEHGSSTDSSGSMHTARTLTPTSQLEFLSIQPQPGNPGTGMSAPVTAPSSGAYGGARPRRRCAAPETIEEEDMTTARYPAPCMCTRCGSSIEPAYAAQYPGSGLCQRCFGGEYEESVPLAALIESSMAAEAAAALSPNAAIQPPDLPREGIMRVSQWVVETEGMTLTDLDDISNPPISAAEAIAGTNWGGSSRNIADTNVSSLTNLDRTIDSDRYENSANLQYRTMDPFLGRRGAEASVPELGASANISSLNAGGTRATASGMGGLGLDSEVIDSGRVQNVLAPDASGSNINVATTGVAVTAPPSPIRPTNFPTGFGTPADGVRAIISNRSSSLGSGGSGGSGTFPGIAAGGRDSGIAAGGSDSGSATGGGDVRGPDSGVSEGNSPAREGSPRDLRSRSSPYSTSRRSSRDSPSSPGERGRGGKIKKPSGSRMALVTYEIADDAFAAMFPKLRAVNLRSLLTNKVFKITILNFPESSNQSSTTINDEQNSVLGDIGSEGRRILNTSKDSRGDSFECSDEEDSF